MQAAAEYVRQRVTFLKQLMVMLHHRRTTARPPRSCRRFSQPQFPTNSRLYPLSPGPALHRGKSPSSATPHNPGAALSAMGSVHHAIIKYLFCTKKSQEFLAICSQAQNSLKFHHFGTWCGAQAFSSGLWSSVQTWWVIPLLFPLLSFQGLFKESTFIQTLSYWLLRLQSSSPGYSIGREKPAFWLEIRTLARMV